MKRYTLPILAVLALLLVPGAASFGDVSTYVFGVSSGSPYTIPKPSTIYSGSDCSANGTGYVDDNSVAALNIGFTFVFDGVAYTKFSVSTNGLIGLFRSWSTTAVSSCWSNYLATNNAGGCFSQYLPTIDSVPNIAPYWDDLRLPSSLCTSGDGSTTGVIQYGITGSAPNRVLVIDFQNMEFDYYTYRYASWQARFYETSNKIEFWYGGFGSSYSGDGASIGISAIRGSSFLSVTPGSSGTATVSGSSANDNVNPTSPGIPANTVYTFSPCKLGIAGNTSQGGTATMANGDSLLVGTNVQVGDSRTFQPVSISLENSPCVNRTYSFAISGPRAVDYSISPTGGTINANSTVTPTLTYTPRCAGAGTATLTVSGSDGTNLTYPLAARATAQAVWTGNMAQGGTLTLANGDTLLGTKVVTRKTTATFTPFSIQNTNLNSGSTPLQVMYTLTDPTGQYTISTSSATLTAGQTSTPVITFNPIGVANQPATLAVNDGCQTRTFVLYAFSAAPGGEFILGGTKLGPTIGTFINYSDCVGENPNSQALTITNTGIGDFIINNLDFYRTDTTYKQGTPAYPLMRDQNNNPIFSRDYILTTQPAAIPLTPNQLPTLPIVIPQGQSRTYYLTFVGQYPGKRFARAFIQTNGQNFLGTDLGGNQVEGLLNFDLFARATGSSLSDNSTGGLPKMVVFPQTSAGDSVDATISIFNTGICDLRISKSFLKIFSGDVNEFKIVSAFPGIPTDSSAVRNDYVFTPGTSGTLTLRFQPSRSGTRRATVWMRTNDSTVYIPGVTNRGDYFLELYGPGKAGLDVPDVTFQPAIIDGENSIAEAMVVNSSTELVGIAQIRIIGPDAAEFAENPAKKWPSPLPKGVQPGEELKLSIVHTATSGSAPGPRQAKLEITLTNGQVIIVELNGAAWTRTASASLSKPFTTTSVGALQRRVIRIENTGWAPLVLQVPTLTGLDASEFALGNLSRMVLDSGQVEFLEITYAPTRAGTATATVNIMSNATNGAQTVTLNASAKTARGDEGVDDGAITIGRENEDGDNAQTGTSGVNSGVIAGVLELRQSVPNPGSGNVKISYVLSERGQVSMVLYNERGGVVKTLMSGAQESGEHAVTVDVSGLPSGVYHYRLEVNGRMVSRTMRVVH